MKFRVVTLFTCTALFIAAAIVTASIPAAAADSGETAIGQSTVEAAFDDSNGSVVYLLTPSKAPLPSKANSQATAPLYIVAYPLNSAVPSGELNCQPTNCDHLNVLPFNDPDYDSDAAAQNGTDPACIDFNGGNPCSRYEGHDHLAGIASAGGDFNVSWSVVLVIFTHQGFQDGAINTRVTTLSQLQSLLANGDAIPLPTPIVFYCASTSQQTYDKGTPVVIAFP